MKIVAQNKKAYHDYSVLDTIEAGVVLSGDEVKSLRLGHAQLKGSFARITKDEIYLFNVHISLYMQAYDKQRDEEYTTRNRKLLLHKRQIKRLVQDVACKGITLVPLKIYFNGKGLVKVAIGLCKGKKNVDKRASIKEKDIKRQTARELKRS